MYVRLATKGPDYAKCVRLLPLTGNSSSLLSWRSVPLKANSLGYLTTNTKLGYIVAGPLWILPTLSRTGQALVLMRLATGYENTLATNGIDRFLFWIGPDDTHYQDIVKRALGLEPFEIDDSGHSLVQERIQKELV